MAISRKWSRPDLLKNLGEFLRPRFPGYAGARHVLLAARRFFGCAARHKGLKAIAFTEGEEGVVAFCGDWETCSFLRHFREWLIHKFGKEGAVEVAPSYLVESTEDAARHSVDEAAI